MSYASVWSLAPMEDDTATTIAEHFQREEHDIESLEQTQCTDEKGKCFILYKEENIRKVQNFVDNILPQLFGDFMKPEYLVAGYNY
eukprot:5513961-Ditylum_brightwellii.AAC.1